MSREEKSEQWYTNRDLFEKLHELRDELRETRESIRKYNGLWPRLEDIDTRLACIESVEAADKRMWEKITSRGGWIIGALSFLVMVYVTFLQGGG